MRQRLVIPSREEVDTQHPVQHPWWKFSVRFNVAVGHSIPVARMHERESERVMMRWGLVHRGADGVIHFGSRGSVRADRLQSAPELRTQWLHGQRGIVPLSGFYVWQRTAAGHAQPYYVRLVNRPVFGVAALWDHVESDEGDVHVSCALISVPHNPLMAEIDSLSEQMPAILRVEHYQEWLSGNVPAAMQLLQVYPQSGMLCYPVSPRVNHLRYDEPGLIRRVALHADD
jgi:putative SOS response-associated peptidase YedK